MSSRCTTIFSAGLLMASALLGALSDPVALSQHAREIVLADRAGAISSLREAIAIWDKQSAKTDDYAGAVLLLAMALHPPLAKDKETLETQVEPLVRKALEIRQQNPDVKTADLALALEVEALVLEEMGRIEDSRPLKSKARELRDQLIAVLQPPYDDVTNPPFHLGGAATGIVGPRLMARGEPSLTFEARVLKLQQPEVLAEVVIAADGQVRKIEMWKPVGFGLDEEAVSALLRWRFKPAEKNGMPVPVEGNLRMRFLP